MPGCVEIDTRTALLPFATVLVNDEEVLTQPGSTVQQVLQEKGHPNVQAIALSLEVHRDYAGRMTAVEVNGGRSELLGLSLLGGEAVDVRTEPGR